MSDRELARLGATTDRILANLELYEAPPSGAIGDDFRKWFVREVENYFQDEWYELDAQLQYLQLLRDSCLDTREAQHGSTRSVIKFFDLLQMLAADVLRRSPPYGWPLLVLVGFGDLARKKMTGPLKDLLPHTPFDLWIVDQKNDAREIAKNEFINFPFVEILSPEQLVSRFKTHDSTTKIAYIATDTRSHFRAVETYLNLGTDLIAVEKPLCSEEGDFTQFQAIEKLTRSRPKPKLFVVDHYSFRRASLVVEGLKKEAPEFAKALDGVDKVIFRMLETDQVDLERGAADEGVIFDMLPHLFPFVNALYTTNFKKWAIDEVKTWRYEGFTRPAETYARVRLRPRQGLVVEAMVGKGVNETIKEVQLIGKKVQARLDLLKGQVMLSKGSISFQVGGTSTRELSYGYVIQSLLAGGSLEFQGLQRGLEVAKMLLRIRKRAKIQGTYALGSTPDVRVLRVGAD